jgi:hypothetical protein
MATPTRRAVLKGTAALAGLAVAQTSGLAPAAEAAPAGSSSEHPKANVLLVHGAWVPDLAGAVHGRPHLRQDRGGPLRPRLPPHQVAKLILAAAKAGTRGSAGGRLKPARIQPSGRRQ